MKLEKIHAGTTFALALGLLFIGTNTAFASCEKSEQYRVAEEMNKLATRNAWSGVERNFEKLENLAGCEVSFDQYYTGSQSARFLGKTWEVYQRLEHAKALKPQEEVLGSLAAIDSAYGRVRLSGNPRRPPELSRAAMPFAPDQKKSIEWAQLVMTETGKFEGMLPAGEYILGGVAFTVEAGQDWVDFSPSKVAKEKPPKGEKPAPDEKPAKAEQVAKGEKPPKGEKLPKPEKGPKGPGLIIYHGPVAVVGPNFLSTPEPSEAIYDGSGGTQYAPSSLGMGTGFGLNAGYEFGFTKEFGLAPVLGYSGVYGSHTYHSYSGWLAFAIRPGDLRVAVGPSFSVISGKGTGVATWWELEEKVVWANEDILYKGSSSAAGGRLTVGYGLVDLEPFQGVVELGGSFRTDGARNYFDFGLSVGIVPWIKRFKG